MEEKLEQLSRILARCFIATLAVVLFWFATYMLLGNTYCDIQATFFGLSYQECALATYCGIGLTKLFMWVFFIVPWIAIRLELRRMKSR